MAIVRTSYNYEAGSPAHQVVEESVGNGETGNPVILYGRPVSLALHPAGTAKVQFTLSGDNLVVAGTARWIDWARGNVTVATADISEGDVTAVRAVSVSGAAVLEVIR